MNESINYKKLSNALHTALLDVLSDKSTEELKNLDWLTWETDFFIEQHNSVFDEAA